ncbi:MAG: class I SAM-dependent methyltransferase [Deltaproteobacteria bacterium]|nr:class I SAM-dependent methyltransferase [Deltaproteobacteria bacterium]
MDDFVGRLRKQQKKLRKWAKRTGTDAWRVYDRDIPGHRYIVEWYAGQVRLLWLPSGQERRGVPTGGEAPAREAIAACAEALEVPEEAVHLAIKAPKAWRQEQYEVRARTGRRHVVTEAGLKFWVNLDDYLDTGLFLDHRETRARVGAEARGKRVLNLFCYTGSFSVHAAAGGAQRVTSVDLSNTYLDWAEDNFALNDLPTETHDFLRSDVLRWLFQGTDRYDLIVLDPPAFSASKKMESDFEVQRDHQALLRGVRQRLEGAGTLYFSANYRSFDPAEGAFDDFEIEELTPGSIPEDFRDKKIHRCFRGTPRKKAGVRP